MGKTKTRAPAEDAVQGVMAYRRRTPLSAIQLAALALAFKKEAERSRGELKPGDGQAVDVAIHVTGVINVGGDQTAQIQEKPSAETLLGMVLGTLGPKGREKALEHVRERCGAFVAGGEKPQSTAEEEQLAEELVAAAGRLKIQNKRGTVTAAVSVEALELVE